MGGFSQHITSKLEQVGPEFSSLKPCLSLPFVSADDRKQFPYQDYTSLRASSPIWVSEVSLARTREREGRGKESLQRSLLNFHFHPGNPGTPQSVKTVTANVPQIRKVTTACQVISQDSRGRVELFIYLYIAFATASKQCFYMFFFHEDIEFQRVRSDKNSLIWFSFRLLLKSHPYGSVEDYSPSQSSTKTSYICPSGAGE